MNTQRFSIGAEINVMLRSHHTSQLVYEKESEAVSKSHIALLHQFHHFPAVCILGHIHVKQLHRVF